MKVTMTLIVGRAFGTVPKNLEKRLCEIEIGGRIETIQTTAVLKSAKIHKNPVNLRRLVTQNSVKNTSLNWC